MSPVVLCATYEMYFYSRGQVDGGLTWVSQAEALKGDVMDFPPSTEHY